MKNQEAGTEATPIEYSLSVDERALLGNIAMEMKVLEGRSQGILNVIAVQQKFDVAMPVNFDPPSGILKGTVKR